MKKPTRKVLFTSHTANFSKFNRPLMRWFKEKGYEVHYASSGEEEVLDCDVHYKIPFSRSPFNISNFMATSQLKKIIDDQDFELIHTHTPMGSVVTRLAAVSARSKGTRVIYTAHGFHFFKGAALMNWIIFYSIEKIMAKFTDTIITINKEDYLRVSNNFHSDVEYIPGVGIDTSKFDAVMTNSEKVRLRQSLGLKQSDFLLIYVAEISKRKNQLWLIDSLSNFLLENPSVHLLLVGKDSLNNECTSFAKDLKLSSQVHILGYRKDIPQLMKISNLAVSASKQEGLPMNIIEAVYLGLPTVVTDCRGNRDIISNNENGFVVDLNDKITFQKKVESIYNKTAKLSSVSIADDDFSNKYSVKTVLALMEGIYNLNGSLNCKQAVKLEEYSK
jgi:glycosyltransferase EpsD